MQRVRGHANEPCERSNHAVDDVPFGVGCKYRCTLGDGRRRADERAAMRFLRLLPFADARGGEIETVLRERPRTQVSEACERGTVRERACNEIERPRLVRDRG